MHIPVKYMPGHTHTIPNTPNTIIHATHTVHSTQLPMEVWHFEGELRSYHIGTLQRLSVAARVCVVTVYGV